MSAKIYLCLISTEISDEVRLSLVLTVAESENEATGKALAVADGKYPDYAHSITVKDVTAWIGAHHVNGEVR